MKECKYITLRVFNQKRASSFSVNLSREICGRNKKGITRRKIGKEGKGGKGRKPG